MALQDPVVAYNAKDPYEATLLCQALNAADISATVIDDEAQAGVWLGGLVPEVNKTEIWIGSQDLERARLIFLDFEKRAAELQEVEAIPADYGREPIPVVCDSCGAVSTFAPHLKGSVQLCEKCGAYLDVGETEDDTGEWNQVAGETDNDISEAT